MCQVLASARAFVEVVASGCCLSDGLAADAQGSPDLGPGGSFGSGGVDHETRSGVEGCLGRVAGARGARAGRCWPRWVRWRALAVRLTHHGLVVPASVLTAMDLVTGSGALDRVAVNSC